MTQRPARRFRKRLLEALRPDGWRPSDDEPVVTVPSADTFVRELANGWVAVLTACWHDRDEIELPSWLPGTHGVITVESSATFPTAERLGARLVLADPSCDSRCGFAVAPPFVVPGQEPGYRQFRGPEDHERVVAEIARYAGHVLVPAAERGAGLDGWMAAYDATGEDGSSKRPWTLPVMQLAHGDEDQASECLRAAWHDPDRPYDRAFDAFATRFDEFVRSGEELPTDGEALTAVAARRTALVLAAEAQAESGSEVESADQEEVSGWQAVGGLVLIAVVLVYFVGKGAAIAGIDIGWSWFPAAAVVAFGVIKIAEQAEELRGKWGGKDGAERVQEYLERQREQREPDRHEQERDPGND